MISFLKVHQDRGLPHISLDSNTRRRSYSVWAPPHCFRQQTKTSSGAPIPGRERSSSLAWTRNAKPPEGGFAYAGPPGIGPGLSVLETDVLPLYDGPVPAR